ncbi:hypothetical protein LCGC14_1407050 [marine sediment metagenome]|uniref:Uncharacterized protein n=1 Tax=marine sediment metagenome TaxID=412755 RepID=A0A0F9JVF2_9ZZZZ
MPVILNTDPPLISIDIYYIEEEKAQGHLVYHFMRSKDDMDEWTEKGYCLENEMTENAAGKIEKLITAWKRLTWKDYNSIVSQCLRFTGKDDDRKAEIDPVQFRDLKLKTCLRRWNVCDATGAQVEVNVANIDAIIPEIANELLYSFEKVTEPGEQDLKK